MTAKKKRLIDFFLTGVIMIIPFFIWYSNDPSIALLNIFLAPLLFLYYILNRHSPFSNIDWFIFGILLAIFATDLANINSQINQSFVWLSLVFVIIYQGGYIYFMRHEKVRVTFNSFYDILKVLIPSIVFFAIFGYFFLDHPNNFEYILILISDVETTLLIILTFFRTKPFWNFYSHALGATLLGITNILYLLLSINYLSQSNMDIMICCYWFSHFFLINSMMKSVNTHELTEFRNKK